MDAMTRAQGMVKQTRKHLKESRGMLQQKGPATSKRSEMIQLRAREKNLRDMLRALDAIEQLKAVPDQLESLVGDKRFLQASLLLIRSLRAINNQDLLVVGALTELRSYLRGQLDTLADILIEELQNHLYLKSFYTRTRWTAYQAGQTECESRQARTGHTTDTSALATVPKTPYDLEDDSLSFLADPTIHEEAQRKGDSRLSRFLTSLALKPSVDPTLHVTDEELVQASTSIHRRAGTATSVNLPADAPTAASPEADSFAYVEMLLESLTTLGRLGYAIDVTTQRLPSELFGVVETVIEEVGERAEIRKVQGIAAKRPKSMQLTEDDDARPASVVLQKTNHDRGNHFRAQIAGLQGSEENSETLKDLFWTTCSKIGAVVEGHRAVYEIVTRITMRGNYRDSSGPNAERSVLVVPLDDIVKPIQAEMRTLVHDYLTDRDRGSSVNRKPLMPINEILREGKVARDKSQVSVPRMIRMRPWLTPIPPGPVQVLRYRSRSRARALQSCSQRDFASIFAWSRSGTRVSWSAERRDLFWYRSTSGGAASYAAGHSQSFQCRHSIPTLLGLYPPSARAGAKPGRDRRGELWNLYGRVCRQGVPAAIGGQGHFAVPAGCRWLSSLHSRPFLERVFTISDREVRNGRHGARHHPLQDDGICAIPQRRLQSPRHQLDRSILSTL